jgi:HSP20 family protein
MGRVIVLRNPVVRQMLQRELEDLFRQQWGRQGPALVRHEEMLWQPPVDVYEVDGEYVVLVELAGMRDSEVSVTLLEDALLISGKRPELHQSETRHFHQLAINEGPFQVAIPLPGPVGDQEIGAVYDDGFLTIRLPKRISQVRRISVNNVNTDH